MGAPTTNHRRWFDIFLKGSKKLQTARLVYGSCNKLQGTYQRDYVNIPRGSWMNPIEAREPVI
jgi:hypothetical protein